MDRLIQDVQLKPLITHADERGFFREVLRVTDEIFAEGFAQWSHSLGHTRRYLEDYRVVAIAHHKLIGKVVGR